ncbi:MAG: cobalt-precorrin 5A hydrolase [Urechidicola sp.]|jgi:cobalt-precorrin 5A hydrolase
MNLTSRPTHIFSLTDEGALIASKLLELIPQAVHHHRPKPFIETAQQSFKQGHSCIFICSTGIVIRALAQVIIDKYQDPPIIVMDEAGEFVIPLLSGHEGGASALAYRIAQAIDAQCVSTSATDYSRPIYTLGMGCDRGCPVDLLRQLYQQVCDDLGPDINLTAFASIDLKADEVGLLELANQIGLALQTYPAKSLRVVEDQLSVKSDIVFKEVGCFGVAEAAALCSASVLTGQPAELIITKRKNARATISVARSYAL